jgi:hypothetical protein
VSTDALASFLPRLTELLERRRVLIVIDNVESLLSAAGAWRDDLWGLVAGALTGHTGLGRVILTSRRLPAGPLPGLRAEAVDALSADEALLLARELPNLSALKLGAVPGIGPTVSRQLARNAITMAQGHPKLLELAEGQAANPGHLLNLVKAGDQEWRRLGGVPEGFFASRESVAGGEEYLAVLAAWTKAVTGTLISGERDLFWFLCCLEEPDRERSHIWIMWPDIWDRLGRDGRPPDVDETLDAIAGRGLVATRTGIGGAAESYSVHPGVAAAGRAQAGQSFRDAVDAEAAAYWDAVYWYGSGQAAGDGTLHTRVLVRAGLAAVPYYLRQRDWDRAALLLEDAFLRDPSRANAAAVLPAIQLINRHAPQHNGALARVLQVINPAAAEATTRGSLDAALGRGDYGAASVAAGRLSDLLRVGGQLAEALDFAGQQAEYVRLSCRGPWDQLSAEVQRLHVLNEMGQASQVLDQVRVLRAHMGTLPLPGADDAVPMHNVRERLLDAGRDAARQLGRWAEALDINATIIDSMRGRYAPATSIAWARFSDYGPLLNLGRTDEALALLLDCRQVFEDARDTAWLGKTLSALADTEYRRGHGDAAIRLERDALRYKYLSADVYGIAVGYHNVGNYLHLHARQAEPALASHLAAALIHALAGTSLADDSAGAAAEDLRSFGVDAIPPLDITDLCTRLSDIAGTDLPGLITRLSPDPETAEQTLRDLITQAQELAATSPADLPERHVGAPMCRSGWHRVITYDRRGAVLIGHSMGTGDVTRYLGSRVAKAVLVSPIPPFLLQAGDNPQGLPRHMFEGFAQAVRADRYVWLRQFLENFYNRDVFGGTLVSDEVFAASLAIANGSAPVADVECIFSWLSDFRDDLPRLDLPVLVIQGDQDRILPFDRTGQRLPGLLKDARLVVINSGPHAIAWTHADQVNAEILGFLT